MTDKIDDGGPAFPSPYAAGQTEEGLTKRDWFAGQALASIPMRNWDVPGRSDIEIIGMWARCAYAVADAMLAARKGADHA